MGITIHYSGTFRSDASLSGFIEEAVAFAEATKWDYVIFEKDFPPGKSAINPDAETRFGLLLLPPDCEPVHLFFNHERQLGFYFDLRNDIIETWVGDPKNGIGTWVPEELESDHKPSWNASTKTQYAGPEIHKQIVLLFRQLSVKYFSKFEVIDEADYWENGDDDYLNRRFGVGIEIDLNNIDPRLRFRKDKLCFSAPTL